MPPDLNLRLYGEARTEILSGDIGLARPDSLFGTLITHGTHAVYSHATIFGWAERTLLIGETREGCGGRAMDAESEIRRSPAGCYDMFRVRSAIYNGHEAWRFALHAGGAVITGISFRGRDCGASWAAAGFPLWPTATIRRARVTARAWCRPNCGPVAGRDCGIMTATWYRAICATRSIFDICLRWWPRPSNSRS